MNNKYDFAINFCSEVKRRFGFLESCFGLAEDRRESSVPWEEKVAYSGPRVRLEVYLVKNTREVGVRFEDLISPGEQTWDVATYLKLINRDVAASFGYSMAGSDIEVIELLEKYATALRELCPEIPEGDASSFIRFRRALETGKGLAPIDRPSVYTGQRPKQNS